MEFDSEVEALHLLYDYDAVEKVFTNLFSNAIKYTPDGLNVCSIGPETTLKAGDQLTVFGDQKSIIEIFKGKQS